MPTYVYECAKCGDEFELWQSFSEEPLKKHGGCGGKVTKVLQPVGIVLKGSGFYKTDNRNGSAKSTRAESSSPDSSGSTSSEKSDKSEKKPDAKKTDAKKTGSKAAKAS